MVSGTGPGDTTSAPAAILGFDHAYYVDRSGEAAVRYLAEGATGVNRNGVRATITADHLQREGIDQTPPTTRYCVRIVRDRAPGRWHVQLTQQVGHDIASVAQQLIITTTTGDGWTLITAIVQR